MSGRIRIKPAPQNPDTEVKITFPNGRWMFVRNEFLLPMIDSVSDWIETGEATDATS